MRFLRLGDIMVCLDQVDDPDVLSQAAHNRALAAALRIYRPENWHGSGIRPADALAVAESGIPVAWVPPMPVLQELVAAAPGDRISVLMAHETEVLSQCRALLDDCDDEWVEDDRTLLGRAFDAYDAGFHEAAMALAVAVGERLALWGSVPRVQSFESREERAAWEEKRRQDKYNLARLELSGNGPLRLDDRIDVARRALIAPIPSFFTPYYGRDGEVVPTNPSRHVTAHRPTVAHLCRENALVCLMLGVSLLRAQQEWSIEVRMQDAVDDTVDL